MVALACTRVCVLMFSCPLVRSLKQSICVFISVTFLLINDVYADISSNPSVALKVFFPERGFCYYKLSVFVA